MWRAHLTEKSGLNGSKQSLLPIYLQPISMDTVLKILIFLKIGCVVLFPLEDQENHVGMTKLVFFLFGFLSCFYRIYFVFICVCKFACTYVHTETHSVGVSTDARRGCRMRWSWSLGRWERNAIPSTRTFLSSSSTAALEFTLGWADASAIAMQAWPEYKPPEPM